MQNLGIIGNRIREERCRREWLISQLAERTDISVAHLSSIERGKVNFSIDNLISISSALEVDINYLLFGELRIEKIISYDLQEIINDCDKYEVNIIIQNAKSLKEILRRTNKI